MDEKKKALTYIKGNVKIKIEYYGKYSIPESQSDYWIDTSSIINNPEEEKKLFYITETRPIKTGRYPKVDDKGYLHLRELNPNPSSDEVMYSEADINVKYFKDACERNDIARQILDGEAPEGTNGILLVGSEEYLKHRPIPEDELIEEDKEEVTTGKAPEQILVTGQDTSKEVAFVEKMLTFIPDELSSKVRVFKTLDDAFKLNDKDVIRRILHILPKDLPKEYNTKVFVLYLGNAEECDSFTFSTSVVGLHDLIKSELTFRDITNYSYLNWEELGVLAKDIDEGFEQFETWVLDTFADIRMYDEIIDPFKLMALYDNIGVSYIQHNNGRDIFDAFVLRNDFKSLQVNIDRDIYTGYYANHVLFIKDCTMNYLRMYVFDVLLSEDEIFDNTYGDPGYKAIFVTDLDFSDNILDDIRECMFAMYEQAFVEYNAPCRTVYGEEDTSRDV